MKRTWQAVGVIAGAAGLVLGGMGLAGAVGHDASSRGHGAVQAAAITRTSPNPEQDGFVPITPCRIADTRASGKVGPAGRSFYVGGESGFPAQGGSTQGCGIPASATAVAANLVSVNATSAGFLKAFPAGSAAPSASVLNYGTTALANELPLAVRPGSDTGLTVTASTPTNVLIDITGYYAHQIDAVVGAFGDIASATSAVTGSEHTGTGAYTLTVDRDVFGCAATASSPTADVYVSATTTRREIIVNTHILVDGVYTESDQTFSVVVTC